MKKTKNDFTVSNVIVSNSDWNNAKSLRAKFLSEVPFEAGILTPIKQSEIKATENGNEGQILLVCTHSTTKQKIRMALYDFKTACEDAGIAGRDGNGNLLAVNASNIDGKFVVLP